ncbi:MAG: hypothetical protein II943_02720 [Victivallales bacterium]|nr:hypothetical protein [Victivallales bacterium]
MIQLLDIEKELAGPDGQAALEKYDQTLVALDGRLADALRQGLSPDDYSAAENLQKAVVIARKLLRLAQRDVGQGS